MTATMARHPDRISVRIEGTLGYDAWQTMRSARCAADAASLPLWLDLTACERFELGGMGAVLLAQERLETVRLHDCPPHLTKLLEMCGVCRQCSSRTEKGGACAAGAAKP